MNKIEQLINDLYDRLMDLSTMLVNTYWFMFKKRWELSAYIKQIKALLEVATSYL